MIELRCLCYICKTLQENALNHSEVGRKILASRVQSLEVTECEEIKVVEARPVHAHRTTTS